MWQVGFQVLNHKWSETGIKHENGGKKGDTSNRDGNWKLDAMLHKVQDTGLNRQERFSIKFTALENLIYSYSTTDKQVRTGQWSKGISNRKPVTFLLLVSYYV